MRDGDQNHSIEDGRRHRWNEEDLPTFVVVEAVVSQTGVDPTDLRPLYEVVDPDALDALFHSATESRSGDVRVRFSYAGCSVTVDSDGWVTVVDED